MSFVNTVKSMAGKELGDLVTEEVLNQVKAAGTWVRG